MQDSHRSALGWTPLGSISVSAIVARPAENASLRPWWAGDAGSSTLAQPPFAPQESIVDTAVHDLPGKRFAQAAVTQEFLGCEPVLSLSLIHI